MKLNLTADEVLTTTRSVRKRLDFDRPVDRATVEECLEIALQAPTGSNRQGWHWVVVEDPTKKQAVADIYKHQLRQVPLDARRRVPRRATPAASARTKVRDSASYLADNFHRAPMLLIPCLWGRLDNASVVQGAGAWGSLLPAVWSFMLALRERGMGSAWTTIHLMNDGERQVAELLGIPYDKVSPGRAVPDRLHDRHRLQAGQARAARHDPALGPVVTAARYQAPGWFTRRVFNPTVARLTRWGISVKGSRMLEVRGRTSGEIRSTVVNLLRRVSVDGARYLVAPRGETQWVRNLHAAGGGTLRVGRRVETFTATELADADKAAILRAYLKAWAWEVGKFFDGLKADSPDADVAAAAPGFPAFRIS